MLFFEAPDYPVFQSVILKIKHNIVTSVYRPGAQLPSCREIAKNMSVNPSAVLLALRELSKIHLIEAGENGTYTVTVNQRQIAMAKFELAKLHLEQFITALNDLNCTDGQIRRLIADNIDLSDNGGEKS